MSVCVLRYVYPDWPGPCGPICNYVCPCGAWRHIDPTRSWQVPERCAPTSCTNRTNSIAISCHLRTNSRTHGVLLHNNFVPNRTNFVPTHTNFVATSQQGLQLRTNFKCHSSFLPTLCRIPESKSLQPGLNKT